MSVNFNTVAIVAGPGTGAGQAARVRLETAADPYVEVVNEVVTGGSGGYPRIEVEREVLADGMRFTVKGSVPAGGEPYWVPVSGPSITVPSPRV